jgi:thiamine-phosphate pyrophosphorylase
VTDASPRPAERAAPLSLPPVYPIIDVDLCRMRGVDPVALATACLAGGARLLQIRQKSAEGGSGALLELVRQVIVVAAAAGAGVIVNDRADIAMMSGAAGVHIGQQDLHPPLVRSIVGEGSMLGLSTHTPEQVDDAVTGAVDYVAVGPIFTTATKDTGYEPRGLELVAYAASKGKPVVAIGGITLANAREALNAGAASVAIISDLLAGSDPESRVRRFLESIAG